MLYPAELRGPEAFPNTARALLHVIHSGRQSCSRWPDATGPSQLWADVRGRAIRTGTFPALSMLPIRKAQFQEGCGKVRGVGNAGRPADGSSGLEINRPSS